MDDKAPLKRAWSGHVTHLNLGGANHIFGMAKARVFKFCTQIGYRYIYLYSAYKSKRVTRRYFKS